jgi:hypothetical protein
MTNVERRYTKHHLGIECGLRLAQIGTTELGIRLFEEGVFVDYPSIGQGFKMRCAVR